MNINETILDKFVRANVGHQRYKFNSINVNVFGWNIKEDGDRAWLCLLFYQLETNTIRAALQPMMQHDTLP